MTTYFFHLRQGSVGRAEDIPAPTMRRGAVPGPDVGEGRHHARQRTFFPFSASRRPRSHVTAARLVARCIRGLEPLVAAEILERGLGTVTGLGHREVHLPGDRWYASGAAGGRPYEGVLGPRTADDVLLHVAELPDPGPAKAGAGALAALAEREDPVRPDATGGAGRPGAPRGDDGLPVATADAARAGEGLAGLTVRVGDAGELPVPDGGVDLVLCNPPWGVQAGRLGLLAQEPGRWWFQLRRVLAPGGCAVLLLPDGDDLATAVRHGFTPLHIQQVRVSDAQPFVAHLGTAAPRRSAERNPPRPGRSAGAGVTRGPGSGSAAGVDLRVASCQGRAGVVVEDMHTIKRLAVAVPLTVALLMAAAPVQAAPAPGRPATHAPASSAAPTHDGRPGPGWNGARGPRQQEWGHPRGWRGHHGRRHDDGPRSGNGPRHNPGWRDGRGRR